VLRQKFRLGFPVLTKNFSPTISFQSVSYRSISQCSHSLFTEFEFKTEPNPSEQLFGDNKKNRWSADFHFVRFKNLSTLRWFPHIIIRPNRRQSSQQQQQQEQEQTFDNT